MEFKDRLRYLRKEENRLTQVQLAEMLNYGYTAIANYESGRNEPSISDLKKIASIFNVSMDYLLGVNDIRYPYVVEDDTDKFNEFRRYFAMLNEDSKDELFHFMEWLMERQSRMKTPVSYGKQEQRSTVMQAAQEPKKYEKK